MRSRNNLFVETPNRMHRSQPDVLFIDQAAWNVARGNEEDGGGAGRSQSFGIRSGGGRIQVHVVGRPFLTCSPSREGAGSAAHIRSVYEEHGVESLGDLDGAFAVIVVDHERQETHVVTDRLNIVPMYVGTAGGRTAVAAHPDVLAHRLGIETDFDLVTMAQALRMWYAAFPYTYYNGIRELEPATIHTWDRGGHHRTRRYWEAEYRGDAAVSHGALAEQLAASIETSVKRRVVGASNPALLLSAGADSRGILFSAAREKPITCYTFYDEPNSELRLAERLATAAGQGFVGLKRDAEHYGSYARTSTRLMGGMWNFLDGHAIGFTSRFREDSVDLLLTGDFADLLFKGNSLNVSYKTLFGKNLTIKEVGQFSANWRTPRGRVNDTMLPAIEERIREQYAGIETGDLDDTGWWQVGHRRVGVLSRTSAYGGPISLQRALPWDTFMADRAMMEVYEQLTPAARVNGSVWEAAIKRLTPASARNIPNNNWGARVGAGSIEKTARFLYGVLYRKVRHRDIDGTPLGAAVTRGSWPNFPYYLSHSPVVGDLWQPREPTVNDVLKELVGFDPWDIQANPDVRKTGMYFGRLLTLKLWLEDRLMSTPGTGVLGDR